MPFARKYVLWLIAPPAAVFAPLAFLFLSQVIYLSRSRAALLAGVLLLLFAAAAAVYTARIGPAAARVSREAHAGEDLSPAASECLQRTGGIAAAYWVVAGFVLALLGAALFQYTLLGFGYFATAASIVAFPSIAWAYAAGKRQLVHYIASTDTPAAYTGRRLTLSRKIAIIFIGFFLISSAALVFLVSSKVSSTLEQLALSSAEERFERLHANANVLARVDADALNTMLSYIPSGHSLSLVRPGGAVLSTRDRLAPEEVAAIRRLGNGDSSAYVGPHVSRFATLRDGSILVLTVPWAPYQNIPRQIAYYTLLVALLTTALFTAATLILARDVTTPIRQLRTMVREMAGGTFVSARQIFSDDEVGELATSFGETRSNLRGLLARIGGSGSTITDGVRVITGGTESLLDRARNQTELTERSTSAVENVRGGIRNALGAADGVNAQTEDASSRALELQASAEEVARSMDHLFQSVEKTSASTTEMNVSMSEMSRRTDVLSGIGDEVLSFVSQLDSMAGELRASAQTTAEISQQVREDAETGGTVVGRTVDGILLSQELTESTATVIEDLQHSVGSIGQMLNVIEEITNRTNLLALNAAIIAAQAGEHGLGFSVVADEIRELAERTRGSTKEIAGVVKAVQNNSRQAVAKINEGVQRVRDNVALASDASSSLEKIVDSANRANEMSMKISRSLEEQSKASRHLHEVTSRMSDHIAEINRATREQARGTELLAEEAERIRDIAAQVKNATAEQSNAGRGITAALERIAAESREMRDLLERQLQETDRIADASRTMLSIAQKNDEIAREFSDTVQSLARSGQSFESEVTRFRITRE